MPEQSAKKYFLVASPDESTWDKTRPILFLGEWCRLFGKRHELEGLDHSVNHYHWTDRNKFNSDYAMLSGLYERKLAVLSECLGQIHHCTTDIRYWRIIVGPWLRFFIDAVYDRFEVVRTATEEYAIEDAWFRRYQLQDWAPSGFQEFYDQLRYDPLNHVILAECAEALGIPLKKLPASVAPEKHTGNSFLSIVKNNVKKILAWYGKIRQSGSDNIVFVAAYMSQARLKQLQESLGQKPYLRSPVIKLEKRKYNQVLRAQINTGGATTVFEELLNRLIPALMPQAYIENFTWLHNKSLSVFPSAPTVIFTANAYQADDGFKCWAAHHTNKQVPLVIGQHGGHFGIGLHNQTEEHQVAIADLFCSWGWDDPNKTNIKPMPALKLDTVKPLFRQDGDILMLTASYPRYFYCYFSVTVAEQMVDYIDEQVRFFQQLDSNVQQSIKIRMDSDQFGWEIRNRFEAAGIGSAVEDQGTQGLWSRLDGCRLAVSTYNATVFLETLAADFPTLVYFDPNKYEIRSEAVPYMELLKKAGILHDTPASAAALLNRIHSDILAWWNDPQLQSARKTFCERFAYIGEQPLEKWVSFFKEISGKN